MSDYLISKFGVVGVNSEDSSKRDFTISHIYATTPEDLWSAITEPERLARWLGPVSGDLREGGEFLFIFNEDDESQRSWGRIEVCEPTSRLEVSWIVPGESDESTLESRVSATITEDGDGAQLTLHHSGLTAQQATGYAAGWHAFSERLGAETSAGRFAAPVWDARWDELFPHYR